MPKQYSHLSIHDRDMIAVLRSQGASLRSIARQLQLQSLNHLPRVAAQRAADKPGLPYYLPHRAQTAGNGGGVQANAAPLHGLECSATIVLSANAVLVFKHDG